MCEGVVRGVQRLHSAVPSSRQLLPVSSSHAVLWWVTQVALGCPSPAEVHLGPSTGWQCQNCFPLWSLTAVLGLKPGLAPTGLALASRGWGRAAVGSTRAASSLSAAVALRPPRSCRCWSLHLWVSCVLGSCRCSRGVAGPMDLLDLPLRDFGLSSLAVAPFLRLLVAVGGSSLSPLLPIACYCPFKQRSGPSCCGLGAGAGRRSSGSPSGSISALPAVLLAVFALRFQASSTLPCEGGRQAGRAQAHQGRCGVAAAPLRTGSPWLSLAHDVWALRVEKSCVLMALRCPIRPGNWLSVRPGAAVSVLWSGPPFLV